MGNEPGNRPITRAITLNLANETLVASAWLRLADMSVHLRDVAGNEIKPQSVVTSTHRKRDSGSPKPKVITREEVPVSSLAFSPNQVLTYYDEIFLVDTNTRTMPTGEVIAVTGFVHSFLEKYEDHAVHKFRGAGAFEFRNPKVDPERLGWSRFLTALLESPHYDPAKSYGLVVDAHINAHGKMNAREEPVLGQQYLPANVTLLYASGDTGSEYVLPNLMNYCDKIATRFHRLIISDGSAFGGPYPALDDTHEAFRNWTFLE